MIPSTIDQWLTRFAAGAGTAYVWTIHDGGLVALLPAPAWDPYADLHTMCPLSAQATLERGTIYYAWDVWEVVDDQEVPYRDTMLLMAAADKRPWDAECWDDADTLVPLIRARLLRICHLEEEAL